MRRPLRIAVVGAGITGLTAGWALARKGHDVVVFEKRNQPGGAIRTEKQGGWLVEYGPNTVQLKDAETLELLQSMGLGDRLVSASPDSSRRYIVKNGQLVALPASMKEAIQTPLFSGRGKLRVLAEPFQGRGKDPDERVASFVQRRLGNEPLDYAINPFVAGIYASRPEDLVVRYAFPRLYDLEQTHGSLTLGAVKKAWKSRGQDRFRRRLVSFGDGLRDLPLTLASQIGDVRTGTPVRRVQSSASGWAVHTDQTVEGGFDRLIMNIPLYHYREELMDGAGELLTSSDLLHYPPLSIVVTGYKRDQISHPLDGFGFLVPAIESRTILGTLFTSRLFPGRAPEGHEILTTFVGGGRQPELAKLESDELFRQVESELSSLLGIQGSPLFKDHIYWPRSIPSYTEHYGPMLNKIEQLETRHAGLHICGNFRGGIAVPDCLNNGVQLAEQIHGSITRD